ncbi:MAG: hypothetical protein JNG85_15110 [Spirochaetaceae bacterium]|nr:hypothetical protein [Spirochaetaceae bacterium]
MAFCLLCALAAAEPVQTERRITALFAAEAAGGQAPNALYLERMGGMPEALRSFAPSSFVLDAKGFRLASEGNFGFAAEGTRELGRFGKVTLYALDATIRAAPTPKPGKLVRVSFRATELAAKGGILQPGGRAIELAARREKYTSGRAWIVELELAAGGEIKALVGLSRN